MLIFYQLIVALSTFITYLNISECQQHKFCFLLQFVSKNKTNHTYPTYSTQTIPTHLTSYLKLFLTFYIC